MTIRSFGNAFEVVDSTRELNTMPQTWTLLGDSGLFVDEYLSQNVVTFQESKGALSIITDSLRGSKPLTQSAQTRKIHSYALTHHMLTDALYPDDLAGKSAYDNLSVADTEAAAIARKLAQMRRSFDMTKEFARFKTIVTGQAWAPNGTVAADFYSDFGFTRLVTDFVFGTATTDIVAKCEEVIASFQASANDGVIVSGVTCYASPVFFAKLIAHAKVQAAYTYYSATEGQSILRNRAGGAGLYRKFHFAGIDFVEVGTGVAGTPYIPSGDCYFVANADDSSFVTYHGPANVFGIVNTIAQPMYMFQHRDVMGREITLTGEMNMMNILRRPNLISRGHSST